MKEFWIIGVGRFGLMAYQRLSDTGKERRFVLVDPIKKNLLMCDRANCTLEQADGVGFLAENLSFGNGPDWIIPALPVHLAAQWLLLRLGPHQLRPVTLPMEIDPLLPNPIRGPGRDIYVSHADFKCPDDCAEPLDICTVTQKKRKKNMFEILGKIRVPPFRPLAVRSLQLGAGIGGYRPEHLFSLLDRVERAEGRLLVSTACRCHGVLTGLERL